LFIIRELRKRTSASPKSFTNTLNLHHSSFSSSKIASSSGHENEFGKNQEVPFVATVDAFPVKNMQSHAPEPELDAEKEKI